MSEDEKNKSPNTGALPIPQPKNIPQKSASPKLRKPPAKSPPPTISGAPAPDATKSPASSNVLAPGPIFFARLWSSRTKFTFQKAISPAVTRR